MDLSTLYQVLPYNRLPYKRFLLYLYICSKGAAEAGDTKYVKQIFSETARYQV